ncbi:MAG: PKD domain-containing protein [Thermodesulfobacteriota bacterium]|nr:PKD domain-containing protein [Thermodesulfobacteriota bacterium]
MEPHTGVVNATSLGCEFFTNIYWKVYQMNQNNFNISPYYGKMTLIFVVLLWIFSSPAFGAEPAYLITYGHGAGTVEGDDDFFQVVFIRMPEKMRDAVYVRIFDADCGGEVDARYRKKFDTRTGFKLFGGKGAYSIPGIQKPTPAKPDLYAGFMLADEEFGEDPLWDNRWYTLAKVTPEDGEKVGQFRYFKVVIEGKEGDDGNAFLITVSSEEHSITPPDEVEIFTFAPTIRLPRPGVFSEMRFFVPEDVHQIVVHNFDLSGAKIGVDTAFRSNLKVGSSGQNEWMKGTVQLKEIEVGRMCALRFEGGREMPNDGTFYVTDKNGKLMPMLVSIYLHEPNARPRPQIDLEPIDDCHTFVFNGLRTLDPEGDALKFMWDFGDGTSEKGAPSVHRYESPGRYQATVIVESDSGLINNSAIKHFTVTVNHPPIANAGSDLVVAPGETFSLDASKSTDADGKVVRHYWDLGDGRKARGRKVSHVYRKPGLYTASLRVEDNSGSLCNFATDQCKVFVNASPESNAGEDRVASVAEPVHFSGVDSRDTDGKIVSYDWNLGDGTKKSGVNITHAFLKPGLYRVRLTVTDDSNAKNKTATDTLTVRVNDPPIARAGKDRNASAGETIRFNASESVDKDGKLIEFLWDFGDGTKQKTDGKIKTITHSYLGPGKYMVTLTVRDDSGSRADTGQDTVLVNINHPPVAVAGPDQQVKAREVTFDASGSHDPDGELIKYLWDFGDGKTGKGVSVRHTYRNPGKYAVGLTVVDDSKTSTSRASDEMTVTVNHLPIADAGRDRVGMTGQVFTFDGSASVDPDGAVIKYVWDFGDGAINEGIQVTHSYSSPGKYNVLLTVYDNFKKEGGVGFDETVITINRPPVAVAGDDLHIAPGEKVLFDGSRSYDPDGKIVSYQWDFSDKIETGKSTKAFQSAKVRRSFDTSGTYSAILTVVDNCRVENSTSQDKVSIKINHRPRANAGKNIHTPERTVLLDGSASSDADGDPLTYIWNFGDGTPLREGARIFHTFAKGGNYPVILTVDDGTGLSNARSTSSISVKVNDAPVANAGENRKACAGKVVIFDGSSSIDPEGGLMKYHWDFGDGSTAEGVNPTKTYDRGGVYLVTLTVTDDSGLKEGSTGRDQIVVTVVESPVAEAGPDQTACAGFPIRFNGTKSKDVDGLVNSFLWDFGDGAVGGGANPTHVYAEAGTYKVRLTITGDRIGDCNNTDSDEMMVVIHEAPVAEFTCPASAPVGRPITLDAQQSTVRSGNVIQYHWDFGDRTHGEGEKAEHIYTEYGYYVVKLTVTADTETDCNQTTKQKTISINAPPVAEAISDGLERPEKNDRLVGVNQIVTFNGSSSRDPDGVIADFDWDFGDGNRDRGVLVRHQYKKGGSYKVVLRVTDNTKMPNKSSTDTLTISVNETPLPVIKTKKMLCAGEEVLLSASGSYDPDGEIAGYTWHFGDMSPPQPGKEVRHTYPLPGNYTATLEVDDGSSVRNSLAQTSVIIKVNEPPVANAGLDQIVSPGEKVLFNGSATKDRDGYIKSYRWDFGDGSTAKGAKPTHRYKNPGKYRVKLVAMDNSETNCNTSEDIVNIRVNAPPVAVIKSGLEKVSHGVYNAIVFDATGSYDLDNDPLTYSWKFGDGQSAQGPKVTHRFKKPGKYTVKLSVDDGSRLKSSVNHDEVVIKVK